MRLKPFITDAEVARAIVITVNRIKKMKPSARRRMLEDRVSKLKAVLKVKNSDGLISPRMIRKM